nr:hypothetical protein [Tanacetum cinerariifolium]
MPKVLLLAWDRVFEIKDALGNKQYKPKDIKELFRKLLDDLQNIHKELAEYINTPGWNRPAFYDNDDDDDVDYTIAITPILSTEEPDNSLTKYHIEIVINSNDDYSSSDDVSLYNENIEYVEVSPHDSELVSLEVAEIVIPEDEEIENDNLREKLLKSSSTFPKSVLEETNTFDDSFPEFENFCFDLEEISSGGYASVCSVLVFVYGNPFAVCLFCCD